jgi:hypothetical protein
VVSLFFPHLFLSLPSTLSSFCFQLLPQLLHPDLSGNETITQSLDAQRVQRRCQRVTTRDVSSILRRCLTIPLFTRKPYLSCCGKMGNEKETQKIVFNRIGAGSIFLWFFWHTLWLFFRSFGFGVSGFLTMTNLGSKKWERCL